MGWSLTGNIKGATGAAAPLPSVAIKAADQAITSTTDVDVTDLTYTVASTGKYYFKMYATCTATGTSPTARWRVTGPTAGPIAYSVSTQTTAVGVSTQQQAAGWSTNTGTQTIPAATTLSCEIVGYANITATGTLKIQLAAPTGTIPSISVKAGSVFIVEKIA